MKMKSFIICILITICPFFYAQAQIGRSEKKKWTSEQVDAYIKNSDLIPIMVNGDNNNRINRIITNRWSKSDVAPYNSPKMRAEFVKDINESLIAAMTLGDPRAKTDYANYKDFFNVYGLWNPNTPEWGKGIDIGAIDDIRDKLFFPLKDEYTGWVTFLAMPNLNSGGGGASRDLEKRYGSSVIAGNGIGKMLHEISHTCMSLGDEYTGPGVGLNVQPTYSSETEYLRDKVKWRKWIDPTTPVPTPYTEEYKNKVGVFEGNQYHLTSYYRSSAQGCIMGAGIFDNTEELCHVCEQRVAMRVYDLVNPINSISPANTTLNIKGKTMQHFSVNHITPKPNTQVVRWILNGKIIATGVDEINVDFGAISKYELVCSITDETPFIRPDPPYAQFPKTEVKWVINNSKPQSKAANMSLTLNVKKGSSSLSTIKPIIKGGVAPFTYLWSNKSNSESLINVDQGIYDLNVIDREFRTAKAHVALYGPAFKTEISKSNKANSTLLQVTNDVTASTKGENNGKIALSIKNGKAPYQIKWLDVNAAYGDGRIYEPQDAIIKVDGFTIKSYTHASNNSYVNFNEKEGSITFNVEVANSGTYPINLFYGGISMKGSSVNVAVNGVPEKQTLNFLQTRPLYIGWEKSTFNSFLKKGMNTVTLISNGQSIPNIDFLSVPSNIKPALITDKERINLSAGNYSFVATDANNNSLQKTLTVKETAPLNAGQIQLKASGPNTITVVNPMAGYTYKWYKNDAPVFIQEKYEHQLLSGINFSPKTPGNYYVALKNNATNAESYNRVGFKVAAISQYSGTKELNPSELGDDLKLWLDASDLNGDGKEDVVIPARGYNSSWTDKVNSQNKLTVKYEPNQLNGKGVSAYDNVWLFSLKKPVESYQTIIMVYKESNMTLPGYSPFKAWNSLMGKSDNIDESLFNESRVDENTKNGAVYLNGYKINPFHTPNPMDYCILTIQLANKSNIPISRTEGYWEGNIAEMIVVDRVLSDTERKGIEEYLRKKWLAGIELKF